MEDIDRKEFSDGFDAGNFASAYESETYDPPNGQTGYYRVGYLLGFYSSFEAHEIPVEDRPHVARYRAEIDSGEGQIARAAEGIATH